MDANERIEAGVSNDVVDRVEFGLFHIHDNASNFWTRNASSHAFCTASIPCHRRRKAVPRGIPGRVLEQSWDQTRRPNQSWTETWKFWRQNARDTPKTSEAESDAVSEDEIVLINRHSQLIVDNANSENKTIQTK